MNLIGPIALVVSISNPKYTHVATVRCADGETEQVKYDQLIDIGRGVRPQRGWKIMAYLPLRDLKSVEPI